MKSRCVRLASPKEIEALCCSIFPFLNETICTNVQFFKHITGDTPLYVGECLV